MSDKQSHDSSQARIIDVFSERLGDARPSGDARSTLEAAP
jgi:hypothetical protein